MPPSASDAVDQEKKERAEAGAAEEEASFQHAEQPMYVHTRNK